MTDLENGKSLDPDGWGDEWVAYAADEDQAEANVIRRASSLYKIPEYQI